MREQVSIDCARGLDVLDFVDKVGQKLEAHRYLWVATQRVLVVAQAVATGVHCDVGQGLDEVAQYKPQRHDKLPIPRVVCLQL